MSRIGMSRFTLFAKCTILVIVQHPLSADDISNEMLAFQANIVCVQGAGKTRSGSDRPHEECKAFRMEGAAYLSDKENHHEKNTDCCRYAE